MISQKGFTLTEIMIAVGVVSALMINGYNFYNNAIAKAQANEAMTAAKKVIDGVIDFHARFEDLPQTWVQGASAGDATGNLSGAYIPLHNTPELLEGSAGSVAQAKWVLIEGGDISSPSAGYVQVLFKDKHIQKQIAGKKVRFYLRQSGNLSHVDYLGCRTDIMGGDLDGVAYESGDVTMRSPILPECYVNLSDAADGGLTGTTVAE